MEHALASTRFLLERGEYGGVQAIPPTLQQSLTARLDRLGAAREVAQIGAVIGRGFAYTLLRAVAGIDEATLQSALDKLADADILLVQGLPPDSDYRFKHALIQDAAYGNLLRSRRQTLHRCVAEALRDNVATAEPELLAHHFTQAGLTEAAIEWWGKAGQRSLERSALAEAAEQLARALGLIETLPGTPALRREQISLQVSLITPLIHVKGYAAPATKAAAERARLLIEQAEKLGEHVDDPLLLFSVLYGFWSVNIVAFNGDAVLELAGQFLALAEKQKADVPLMIGYRLMGTGNAFTGQLTQGQDYLDRAIAVYDPARHRQLAMRFGQDARVTAFSTRSFSRWMLGYPDSALADADQALKEAREIGHAATLMLALAFVHPPIACGKYALANSRLDELAVLADEKGASYWNALGQAYRGCIRALTGQSSEAAQLITSGIAGYRSTGATVYAPLHLSILASAFSELGQFDDALRCIDEAITLIETTKERWWEAEVNRAAGELALKLPDSDAKKAERYLARALDVARAQEAKSWELRAAISMARLWRDQGKRQQAHELLAPVYEWFTEGFDTLDLKEAKRLLDELAS